MIPLDLIYFCLLHTQKEYSKKRKYSASNGEGDKTVHSELYSGSYVTTDDEVEQPKYLLHLPSHNDVIVEIDV